MSTGHIVKPLPDAIIESDREIPVAESGHLYCDVVQVNGEEMPNADTFMKLAGFLLLLAGWALILATPPLLGAGTERAAFVLAGVGIEMLGLVLVVRAHLRVPEGRT